MRIHDRPGRWLGGGLRQSRNLALPLLRPDNCRRLSKAENGPMSRLDWHRILGLVALASKLDIGDCSLKYSASFCMSSDDSVFAIGVIVADWRRPASKQVRAIWSTAGSAACASGVVPIR